MDHEEEMLEQLARRPFDRTLRLVFADWLSERGDPRGEVIALCERGALSLTERRRVTRATQEHAKRWLGPLAELAELSQCRFDGGFLTRLACQNPPAEAWRAATSDPRLATVTSLVLPIGPESAEQGRFVRSPRLAGVRRLQATSSGWRQLRAAPGPAFTLHQVAVFSWGVFRDELEVLASVEAARGANRLDLVTSEFVNPVVAREMGEVLLAQKGAWRHFSEVRLQTKFGVFEGAASWLLFGAEQRWDRWWRVGERWTVEFQETVFTLERADGGFNTLRVELAQNDELIGLGQRISVTASVLVLLAPAQLRAVHVVVPPGTRLRASERDALRAAARRLGSVTAFAIGDTALVP